MLLVYTLPDAFSFSSEMLVLMELAHAVVDAAHNYNERGEWRLAHASAWCRQNIKLVDSIEDCNVAVLPHKFRGVMDETYVRMCDECKRAKKLLACFYNDDDEQPHPVTEYTIVFRTSMHKAFRRSLDLPMAPIVPDMFRGFLAAEPIHLSVGFCGHAGNGRAKHLKALSQADGIQTDFIIRGGYWAQGVDRTTARMEFVDNMDRNLFTLCHRGAGNFSYRLYEALCMGRIPIIVNTDCAFPHEAELMQVAVCVDENDAPFQLVPRLRGFYAENAHRLLEAQRECRALWERRYSCRGVLESICQSLSCALD